MKSFYYILLPCLFAFNTKAQIDSISVSMAHLHPVLQKGYFAFNYDNDFFNATDRYYTQGIRLELAHPAFSRWPLSKILVSLPKAGWSQTGIVAEQQCFTPSSIRRDTIFTGERPFAAVMFIGQYKKTTDAVHQQSVVSETDIGMIGPCAVCEEEQKGIHHALKNIQPLGWQYQLKSAVMLNYSVLYEKGLVTHSYFNLVGSGQLRAGTLYTDASAGILLRTGWRMPDYFAPALSSRPFGFYVFAKGNAKTVGYNATLEGGVFDRSSVYTLSPAAVSRVMYAATGGLVIVYKKLSLEYTRVFITREFKNGLDHGWGHCVIKVSF